MAAGQLYVYGVIEQPEGLARDHGSTGTCAASFGFTHTTLENTKIHVSPVPNAGESHVYSLWESLVVFDERSEFVNRGLRNIGYVQNAVRIAHRHHANLELSACDVEYVAIGLLFGRERNLYWIEFRISHTDRHQSIVIDACFDRAGRALQSKCLGMAAFIGQYTGDTAYAVAALFDLGTVRIEDPVTRSKSRAGGSGDPHQLIKPRADRFIAKLAELRGRRN